MSAKKKSLLSIARKKASIERRFHANLKTLLKEKGIDDELLAMKFIYKYGNQNVSYTYVCKVFDSIAVPSEKGLEHFAYALDCEQSDLIGNDVFLEYHRYLSEIRSMKQEASNDKRLKGKGKTFAKEDRDNEFNQIWLGVWNFTGA